MWDLGGFMFKTFTVSFLQLQVTGPGDHMIIHLFCCKVPLSTQSGMITLKNNIQGVLNSGQKH